MASQSVKGGKVPKNLSKIQKKNSKAKSERKFAQKLQNCDPNSLGKVLKKNRKTKHKNKEKLKKNDSTVQSIEKEVPFIPNSGVSSNWKNLLKNLPKEDEGAKPKPAFVRRNKNGQLITNQPIKHPKAIQIGQKKKPLMKEKKPEDSEDNSDVWFDDVDPMLLDSEKVAINANDAPDALVKTNGFTGITKILGMDCEMVGVGLGGTDSILARVSIVNHFGHKVYDKFVAPREKVTDYRTAVSGVRPEDLQGAPQFKEVQAEVSELMAGRILVGHALKHDLKVLFLDHPKKMIRDTSKYKPFKAAFGGRTPSLKNLAGRFLGVTVQTGEHSSVQDSQAAVRLYTMFRKEWEAEREAKQSKNKNSKKSKPKPEKFNVTKLARDSLEKRAMYCPSDSDED
eukprot:GFUD01019832.1.p1 GENE.GFUD01019832.1~~GFUD01019832.1.p1  ORF type:complete len:397 (-),score=153.24 GFUD01019832.1:69-1259(-)